MPIYLDYSATTPPRPEAIAAMQDALLSQWGNPSSLHQWGSRSAMVLERSRLQVAGLINAAPEAIVFTSGGTEANNLALLGVAHEHTAPQHLIISSVEHSAIAEPAKQLERWGWQVTRLPVNPLGQVDPFALKAALQPNTVLVSIIYGQSEVGTLQPIPTLAAIAHAHGALFHTDAVQVAGRLPIEVQKSQVDLLSLSSHKLYGPQGAGALYVRPGLKLQPLLGGGGQEAGWRSGTQAVAAISGFGVAAELAQPELEPEARRLRHLRDRLIQRVKDISGLWPSGDLQHRLPHHASFCFDPTEQGGLTAKQVVRQMDLAGIGISAGAACHSGKVTPSPILLAMGYSEAIAQSGIRLTLGRHTTEPDIDQTVAALSRIFAPHGQG
jgi:cysteine desulfurase